MGAKRKSLSVKPGGDSSLRRPKFRWDGNIKKGLKQAGLVFNHTYQYLHIYIISEV